MDFIPILVSITYKKRDIKKLIKENKYFDN